LAYGFTRGILRTPPSLLVPSTPIISVQLARVGVEVACVGTLYAPPRTLGVRPGTV